MSLKFEVRAVDAEIMLAKFDGGKSNQTTEP